MPHKAVTHCCPCKLESPPYLLYIMVRVQVKAGLLHLFSALIACGLVAAILLIGRAIAIDFEQSTLSSTAPEMFSLKNQGLAFQRAAASAPDVLPLYGSSELLLAPVAADRAGNFFREAPTGFQVSPVGKPGATTLTILQKIGALGFALRGKKVAISLSPEWFFMLSPRSDWYEGNFSQLAANEIAFGSSLDFELKRKIAARMLQFPRTLHKDPLLEFALRRLASGSRLDRVLFCALWPIGKAQDALLQLQDHFAALRYSFRNAKRAPNGHSEMLNWPELIAKVAEPKIARQDENKEDATKLAKQTIPPWREAGFVARVNAAPEWIDFELLLRALTEIHAEPLLLSMPIAGQDFDQEGVSRTARETYYKKLRMLAHQYHFFLVDFEDHDEDRAFLDRQQNHLTGKGWIFYNRVLDDFFHDRVPRT